MSALIAVAGCAGPAGPEGPGGEQGLTGKEGPPGPLKSPRLLDSRIAGWLPEVRTRIDRMLVEKGIASAGYDATRRPVAVFDWDNTVLKNDIGDATMFWMVANDKIRQPAGSDWGTTNANLTAAAKAALNAACDAAATPGQPIPTSTTPACATAIVKIYDSGTTPAGEPAWSPKVTLTNNNPYAWVAQLQAGYTPAEIRAFAQAAFAQNNDAALGTKQTLGTVADLNGYLRVYDQMADLIGALHDSGFDVWAVSASPQYVVEPIAAMLGIAPNHVIGIRNVIAAGKATANVQGCGDIADGTNTMITFDEGKRCWINKVIFGEPTATQRPRNADLAKRPVFVAGDSDTDIAMLKDATHLKLVLNRGKVESLCNALHNYQGSWALQPMFISPRAKATAPYPCSTATDAAGAKIVDESGATFPKNYEE